MQINRLFEIVYILLDKKTVTAKTLAEHFEVSARTIYRDVATLSAAGIPVYMSQGKGGGISLLPNYILDKTVVTQEEKEVILSSLQALSALNFQKSDTALKKLGSLFGKSNTDWIEVDFSSWVNPQKEAETFQTVKSAILARQLLAFSYAGTGGTGTLRKVEPLKLCFKSGAWYLYGFCRLRKDFRFFKLRRMKELHVLAGVFEREAPASVFSEKPQFQEEFVNLKLKIKPEAAFRVYDEFEHYEIQPDGSFIAQIRYPKGQWLFYYIATFGSSCEVLEPQEVRQEVQQEFEKILKQYGSVLLV